MQIILLLTAALCLVVFPSRAESGQPGCAINVRVVGVNGRPIEGSITCWRTVSGSAAELSTPVGDPWTGLGPDRWQDRVTGKSWEPVHSYGASKEARISKLLPGDYRVSVAAGNGFSPFGVSDVLSLDSNNPERAVTIKVGTGPKVTVSAIDAETGDPVKWFQALLLRSDGFPVTRWSSSPWPLWSNQQDGKLVFEQLPPGSYTLEARRRAFNFGEPDYLSEPLFLKAETGKDQHVSIRLKGRALSDDVVAQRWPFIVTGRVTDEGGNGMEGVTLIAHCGMGSLHPPGETQSGPDGKFVLRFTGGMRMKDGEAWRIGLQAATISPGKAGYVETNLHRQGDLMMADRMPDAQEASVWSAKRDRIVLPHRPYRLDFVMSRAATVQGHLRDSGGKLIRNEHIELAGRELPPSCSVLRATQTDARGRFQFDDVPTGREWWISLPRKRSVRSAGFTLDSPSGVNMDLHLATSDGTEVLEIKRDNGGQ